MKQTKRLIALLLCLVILIGIMPVSVFAAEQVVTGDFAGSSTVIDAAIFFSDLHIKSTDTNYATNGGLLKNILTKMKDSTGLSFSSVTSCGDAFAVNEDNASGGQGKFTGYTSKLNTYITDAVGDVPVNYVWSDHDRYAVGTDDKTLLSKDSDFVYGAGQDGVYGTDDDDNYYIFLLSMADTTASDRYNVEHLSLETVKANVQRFADAAKNLKKDRPLLIAAHQPLLDRRNDNGYAYLWAEQINTIAAGMDVVYFFGHNHAYDQPSDYYYEKGAQMAVEGMSSKMTLNFPHVCVGYASPTSTGTYTRKNVAVAVTIYNDKIKLDTYNSNGLYSGSYKLNAEVTRLSAQADVPQKLSVTGKTDYTVGDSIVAPSTVDVTYLKADNSTYTQAVTDGYALTKIVKDGTEYTVDGFAFQEAGNYTLTYTCTIGNYQAQAELFVTVQAAPAEPTVNTVYTHDGSYYLGATGIGLTGITATYAYADHEALMMSTFDNGQGVAYDITLEGYTDGNELTYQFALDESIPTQNLGLYCVKDGKLTAIPFELVTESGVVIIQFKASQAGTFLYGTVNVPEGYTYSELVVTYDGKSNYFVGEVFALTEASAVAIYKNASGETFERILYEQVEGYIKDGYTITWPDVLIVDGEEIPYIDMNTPGEKTITFTYADDGNTFDASFTVNVWGNTFAAGDVKVDIGEGEFGVKTVTVQNVENSTIAESIQHVIEGDSFVAYDINLEFAENYATSNTAKTVTLPIPANVTNPVVYYVSNDGKTVTNMFAVNNGDGTVSFETNHFSTYVVGQQAGATFVEVTVPGSTQTETVTVYKLVTTPTSGKEYLIVSTNFNNSTTTGYGFDGDTSGYGVTKFTGSDGNYTDSNGNAWTAGNGTYLKVSAGATAHLWTYDGGFAINYNRSGSNNYTYTPASGSNSSADFSYSNSRLTASLPRSASRNSTHYLRYSNNSWVIDRNQGNVYLYEEVTLNKTVGKPDVKHHMDIAINGEEGTKLTVNNVVANETRDLNVVFTSDPAGYAINADNATTWHSSNTNVASVDSNGTLTFTGNAGTTVITATYTWTEGDQSYTVSNQMYVYTTAMTYTMDVVDQNATVGVATEFTPNVQFKDGDGKTVVPTNVVWKSDNENVATVVDGVIKAVAPGTATVTVEWVDPAGVKRTGSITVTVPEPIYTIELYENNNNTLGNLITKTVALKGVKAGDTYSVWAVVKRHANEADKEGVDLGALGDALTWSVSNENIATIDAKTGVITFTGDEYGTFSITVYYTAESGKTVTDTITISATETQFVVPGASTNDFPEYPNPGSINFDKTATAVGNFSKTGMVQMELSMTGIPYGGSKPLDIVLILDRSSSMRNENRLQLTYDAAKAFIEAMAKDQNGNPTNHNIVVADYHGGKTSTATDFGANLYSSDGNNNPYGNFTFSATYPGRSRDTTEVTNITGQFMTLNGQKNANNQTPEQIITNNLGSFVNSTSFPSGTDYDHALLYAQAALKHARDAGSTNKQFVVMMTDGVPTHLRYEGSRKNTTNTAEDTTTFPDVTTSLIYGTDGNNDMRAMFSGTNYENRGDDYGYEYVSGVLKNEGVTIYTVALGLNKTNSAWPGAGGLSQATATQVNNAGSIILNDISGPAYETTRDTGSTISKKYDKDTNPNGYYFNIEDGDTTGLNAAFTGIASKISEAATDVVVTDKISDDYTMVFDIPTGEKDISGDVPSGQKFYIEVVNYVLDGEHERTGEYETKIRVYIGKNANTYFAADENGNKLADPAFTAVTDGSKAYWTKVSSGEAKAGEIIIQVGDSFYKFAQDGKGTHNVTAGAYAYGTINDKNMSEDLVIVTPYFAYSAKTRMLAWTVETVVDTHEIALRYFLYLKDSATEVGNDGVEKMPGSYETNDWAYMTYTNHLKNECQQTFPVPQVTWNGAQVSYQFYLVNTKGEPINRSGQVVDFANAVFITDLYTDRVVWNQEGDTAIGEGELSADWLAHKLLPQNYTVYDSKAGYKLNVYEKADGETIKNQFTIAGGTEAEISAHLNENVTGANTTPNAVNLKTTKVYNTRSGKKVTGYGTYYSTDSDMADIDFSSTVVAFAVVWEPKLVEDTVVVDFGLDVLIDVVSNDILMNTINGIGTSNNVYGNIQMNSGVSPDSKLGRENLTISGHTVSIENENQIRFHQNNMEFKEPVKFFYESPVHYFHNGEEKEGYLHSSVTVIPATTVYYEDSLIARNDLKVYTWDNASNNWGTPVSGVGTGEFDWQLDGKAGTAIQSQDRPGVSQLSAALDADNKYGFDAAYGTMSTHSMGSALKVHVDYDHMATASFSFYGTGFDLISMANQTTGTIIVNVYDASNTRVRSNMVNTYYGYTYQDGEWVQTDSADPNALYQVPVMKIFGLDYGKYTAEVKVVYDPIFDNGLYTDASFDFYLDAVRIYDPTGNQNDDANNAYIADGEGWPVYEELRNIVIESATINEAGSESVIPGFVFIDGIEQTNSVSDYSSYGPNNELYLAQNQAIIFEVTDHANLKDVQLGMKTGTGTASYKIYNATVVNDTVKETEVMAGDITTTTEMYYSIMKQAGGTIVIVNTGTGILSLTNIKYTFDADPGLTGTLLHVDKDVIVKILANKQTSGEVETPDVEKPKLPEVAITNVTVPNSVAAGKNITVTVNTSEETESVTVNGVSAWYSNSEDGKVWTADLPTVKAGIENIDIVASAKDNDGSEVVVSAQAQVLVTPQVFVIAAPATARVDTEITATVTSSADVDYLEFDNEQIKEFTVNDAGQKLWTITTSASEVGNLDINVSGYVKTGTGTNGSLTGDCVVSAVVTVKVIAPFAPANLTVDVPEYVYKGSIITVTVTTGTDVEAVTVNGELIKAYTLKKGKRVWSAKVETTEADTSKAIEVTAYNASGIESVPVTKTVEVKTVQNWIATEVSKTINKLLNWLFG